MSKDIDRKLTHAEGGIIVWIKSNKSLNVEVWESLSSEKVEV